MQQETIMSKQAWIRTKLVARNRCALSHIVSSVKSQEAKEMVLAYFFLWNTTEPSLSVSDLDSTVERFFFQTFGIKFDFDVEDALDKLGRLGLVSKVGRSYRVCITPEEWLQSHPVEHLFVLRLRD